MKRGQFILLVSIQTKWTRSSHDFHSPNLWTKHETSDMKQTDGRNKSKTNIQSTFGLHPMSIMIYSPIHFSYDTKSNVHTDSGKFILLASVKT